MKNIIILGNCRAGKTLLARMLFKDLPGFSFFGTDHMRSAIMKAVLPKVKNFETSPKIKDFDKEWGKLLVQINKNFFKSHLRSYNECGKYFILEGGILKFEDVTEFFDNPDILVVFVGKPGLSPEEYYNDIRAYDQKHHTWTTEHNDADVKRMAARYSAESKSNYAKCQKAGVMFIDTTTNQIQVLKDASAEIKRMVCKK